MSEMKASREKEVTELLARLGDISEVLLKRTEELYPRLSPILRDSQPEAKREKTDSPSRTPMGINLNHIIHVLEQTVDILNDIHERCEV